LYFSEKGEGERETLTLSSSSSLSSYLIIDVIVAIVDVFIVLDISAHNETSKLPFDLEA